MQYTPFAALGFLKVSAFLQLLMIGEMVADKTTFVPARTSSLALAGRAFSGALVGAALLAAQKRRWAPVPFLARSVALHAAYTGEKLRVKGTERLRMPGQLLGFLEDGIVLSLGTRLLRQGWT